MREEEYRYLPLVLVVAKVVEAFFVVVTQTVVGEVVVVVAVVVTGETVGKEILMDWIPEV